MKTISPAYYDLDQVKRHFDSQSLNTPDRAEDMRGEAVSFVEAMAELLTELDGLEIEAVTAVLDKYRVVL